MCGIAGFYSGAREGGEQRCLRMLRAMEYRGPDGIAVERVDDFTLGHLRLAVIDLADTGRQPMRSADGSHVITFNGEIYNYRELRSALEAVRPVRWRGSSDTEVLLEALVEWGVEKTLRLANGMFAFALLDRRGGRLVLARDRFGEKPLVYHEGEAGIAFASEIKGLEAAGDLTLSIDREALDLQSRSYAIAAPRTVYRECRKLPPGTFLEWRAGTPTRLRRYWSAAERAASVRSEPFVEEREAVDALESALARSVELRMVSDVPLGAFLSGGIDSSTVVALMQSRSAAPVKTFAIGFDVEGYNEAAHARAIAAHLGTDHHEQIVTAADALAVVPSLGALFDEPFADPSQIPTWLVSRMARERVTVSLSGDGGDELFCGYTRYAGTVAMWAAINRVPLRRVWGTLLQRVPPQALGAALFFVKPLTDRYSQSGRVGPKLVRFGHWMTADSIETFYERSMQHARVPGALVLGTAGAAAPEPLSLPAGLDPLERMMLDDSLRYLPDDILVKVDRAAMSVSLEGRMPMLDPDVFETAWRLPLSMKQRGAEGKWALKEVLYRHVPRALVERPKMGFGAPVGEWLRTSLREWASDLLSRERLERQGLYDARAVGRLLEAHLDRREERADTLWSLLMVQAWLEADEARERRL